MAIKTATALGSSIPPSIRSTGEDWRDGYNVLRESIRALLQGSSNAIGAVTIESGDSPLTVLDERCTAGSVVLVMIETSDLANNFIFFISAVNNGSFVIEFTYGGQLNPTLFRYLLQG